MQITIELTDDEALFFAQWASVSRTLSSAQRIAEESSHEDSQMIIDELQQLTMPLDQLHQTVRNQIQKSTLTKFIEEHVCNRCDNRVSDHRWAHSHLCPDCFWTADSSWKSKK